MRSGVSERSGSEEDLGVCSQAGSVWFHTYQAHHTHTPAILKKQRAESADRTTCYWKRGNINMLIMLKNANTKLIIAIMHKKKNLILWRETVVF